ncbi:MAG: hypothetical protein KatS3mg088_755 [Patescibacteria group bacterium]|nr:MAG: hypothetical protein KatS3mg088_755 [Patescibacteria group bacterium]
MKKSAKIISIIAISLFVSLSVKGAEAQTILPLTVSPARQTINIDPGTTEKTTISFFNQADIPVAGNLKVVDFIVTDNTGTPYLLEGETAIPTKYSAAKWISIQADKAIIPANASFKVQLTITAPKDAAAGGRYAAVYFEPTGTLPNTRAFINQKEGQQSVTSRLVGLINIRVNGPIIEEAAVKYLSVPNFIEYGPVEVKTEIYNNGSYHITPKGKITLIDWQGKVVDEYTLEERNIFPERSRIYETELGKRLMIGKYKVELLAMYGDSNQILSASQVFWAFPWRITVAIVLAVIIAILLIILITKKMQKRQKELEEKLEKEIDEIEKLKEKFKDSSSSK